MANKLFNSLLSVTGTVTADQLIAEFGSDIDLWIEPRLGGMKDAGGDDATVGEKVATAVDLSLSGGNLTQGTDAERMTLAIDPYSDVLALYNTTGMMENGSWNGSNGLAGQCWLIVYRPTAIGNPGEILLSPSAGDNFGMYRGAGTIRVGSYSPAWGSVADAETYGGQILIPVHDGSQTGDANRLTLYQNNVRKTLGSFSNTVPATYATAGGVSLGGASLSGENTQGYFYCVMHIKVAPTEAQRTLLWRYARDNFFAVPAAQSDWVGEGDSRWKGYTAALDPNFNKAINAKLAPLLGGANVYDYNQAIVGVLDNTKPWNTYNYGQEGDTLITHITSQQAALMLRRDEQKQKQILSLFAFTNDNGAGSTAADVYAALVDYADVCTAKGFKFLAITDPGAGDETAPQTANRLAYNALVRAGWESFADAFYDMALDPNFDDPNDGVNFDISLVHYTEAGNTAAAQGFYDAASSAGIL